eukprot:15480614-Alexandrium_andersonii.AAC.1
MSPNVRAAVLAGPAAADSERSRPSRRGPSRTRGRTTGPAMSPSSGPTVLTWPAAAASSAAEASAAA